MTDDPIPELKRRAGLRIADRLRDDSAFNAACGLRVDERRVWDIRAGRLERFSFEMLLKFMMRLRMRVDIYVDGEKL